jgi:hypothetical protein
MEFFGGTNNVSYAVGTGGRDDGFDIQLGYAGKVQYFTVVSYPDNPGEFGIESDNNEDDNSAAPFTNFNLWNATFVGNGTVCRTADCEGWRARRGLKGKLNNTIFTNFQSEAIGVTEQVTQDNINNNELTINGLVVWNNNQKAGTVNTMEGQFGAGTPALNWVSGNVGTAQRVVVGNPVLRSIVPSDWDVRLGPGSVASGSQFQLPPSDGVFSASGNDSCAGAICGDDDYTEEWTIKVQESDVRRDNQQ